MTINGAGPNGKAIAWALLSQVFWVPLVAIEAHDRWALHVRRVTPPGQKLPEAALPRSKPFSLDDLIGAAKPVRELAARAIQGTGSLTQQALRSTGVVLSHAGSQASSLLDRPLTLSIDRPAAPGVAANAGTTRPAGLSGGLPQGHPAHSLLGRALTRAELLGGSIGLADLQEPPLSPMALVERAMQRSSGDPMAALPAVWREPMRQALLKLPGASQVGPARVVHVPSSRISQPAAVPLALQSDGSVDVLEAPANAAVLAEIESWSRQQQRPGAGTLTPAVVHLHPLPSESAAAAPAPVAVASPAALAPVAPAPPEAPAALPEAAAAPIEAPAAAAVQAAAPAATPATAPASEMPAP